MSDSRRLFSPSRAVVFLLLVAATLFSVSCSKKSDVKLYAGAGMRKGIDALVEAFEKETGLEVEVDYGGSNVVMARAKLDAEAGRDADLFMPGDVWYVDQLHADTGLIESKTFVVWFVPVILVQKGNPKDIHTLADLFRDDVHVALGSSKSCQIGRLTTKLFEKNGLDRSTKSFKESATVNEMAIWVDTEDVDAAIVWDVVAESWTQTTEIRTIPLPDNIISQVVIGLLKTSKNKPAAQKFIDFITSEKGQTILKAKRYTVEEPGK